MVALIVAFVGAVVGGRIPLNVLQLLWVNLIMDTMGALALATENPNPDLLKDKVSLVVGSVTVQRCPKLLAVPVFNSTGNSWNVF
eukprot:jgi/Chrzof1/6095/Cz17g09150.t1